MNLEAIDINLVRGTVLVLLILGFVGIWAWAWSRNRKDDFQRMSMLPLEEDDGQVPNNESKTEGTKE